MARLVQNAVKESDFLAFTIQFPSVYDVDPWVRAHFRYMTEPYEIIMTPGASLTAIQDHNFFVGDCDDVSTFEAAIFKALGFATRLVAIRTKSSDNNFYHVFVEVYLANCWVRYDATIAPGIIHQEYGRMMVNV
jgi:Transglutaminase-like superfamily